MEWLVFALVMVPAVVVTQWLAIRRSKEAAVILSRWAAGEGHKLLETRRAWFYPGPFWLRRGQAVFFIRLVTASGNRRMGWARIGRGWALGPVANAVEVRWDEPGLAGGHD